MRSSRMEATATLAGGIAHDFNNLMVGVLGYTDLLRSEFLDRPDLLRMLDRVSHSAERAGELARQMLAYARGGKYQPRKIELNKIIRDTAKMLARDIPERIHVEQMLSPEIPSVEADPAQMTEVVSGLLNNAVEAISGTGSITLETGVIEVATSDHFDGVLLMPGLYVHLTVSDSGAGMDNPTLSRIFEPFFTTKFQGRGLGLSAVYGIVKNHGGDILVCSEKGRGTIFKVFLPAK
jgi:signal transduction histidine kinase